MLGLAEPDPMDGDVLSFLALLGPLLQRLTPAERAVIMPELVRVVTSGPAGRSSRTA